MMKLKVLRARHAREERALLREALIESDWTLPGAAEALGIGTSSLQYLVERDEALREERARRRPKEGPRSGGDGGGRPAAA